MGLMHNGVVYALWDYSAEFGDELSFREGESVTVLRRDGPEETDWWWATLHGQEGYVPRNYFGVSPEDVPWLPSNGYLGKGAIAQEKGREGQSITSARGGQKSLLLVEGSKGEPPYWRYFLGYVSILLYWLFNWFVLKYNFFLSLIILMGVKECILAKASNEESVSAEGKVKDCVSQISKLLLHVLGRIRKDPLIQLWEN